MSSEESLASWEEMKAERDDLLDRLARTSKVAPRETAPLRFFRFLKSQVIERRKDFIATLMLPQRELLNYDLREMELFLEGYFFYTTFIL